MGREALPVVLHALLGRVDHVVYHSSHDIVVLQAFNFDTLRSNDNALEEGMCRAIDKSNFTLLQIRHSNLECKIRRVRIEEAVSTDEELYKVTTLGTSHSRSGLVPAEHDLILNCLRLDVSVVETIGNDGVYLSHLIINYKDGKGIGCD